MKLLLKSEEKGKGQEGRKKGRKGTQNGKGREEKGEAVGSRGNRGELGDRDGERKVEAEDY